MHRLITPILFLAWDAVHHGTVWLCLENQSMLASAIAAAFSMAHAFALRHFGAEHLATRGAFVLMPPFLHAAIVIAEFVCAA